MEPDPLFYPDDEKARLFRPEMLMRVVTPEFHDDDVISPSFLEHGDLVILLEPTESPVRDETFDVFVDVANDWVVLSRWGLLKRSDGFLATCCDHAEAFAVQVP